MQGPERKRGESDSRGKSLENRAQVFLDGGSIVGGAAKKFSNQAEGKEGEPGKRKKCGAEEPSLERVKLCHGAPCSEV